MSSEVLYDIQMKGNQPHYRPYEWTTRPNCEALDKLEADEVSDRLNKYGFLTIKLRIIVHEEPINDNAK